MFQFNLVKYVLREGLCSLQSKSIKKALKTVRFLVVFSWELTYYHKGLINHKPFKVKSILINEQ